MNICRLFDQLKQPYLLADQTTDQLIMANPAACQLLNTHQSKLESLPVWCEHIAPLLAKTDTVYSTFRHQGQLIQVDYSYIDTDDHSYCAIYLSPSPIEQPNKFFRIIDNLGAYVYCKDQQYNYSYANQQVCELFNLPLEQIIGHSDCKFFGQATGERLIEQSDRQVLEDGKTLRVEETNFIPHLNEYRHYLSVKKPLLDDSGRICGIFGISTDITEQKILEQQVTSTNARLKATLAKMAKLKDQLQQKATHDALTGLYNRHFLEEHCELAFLNAGLSTISLLMIDIDYFKRINDQHGHQTGDEILRLLANVMRNGCRKHDLICRFGGEEFVILLPHTSLEMSLQRAEVLREQYKEQLKHQYPNLCENSISIGVAASPMHGDTFDSVCKAADKALYQAKETGRNRCIAAATTKQ